MHLTHPIFTIFVSIFLLAAGLALPLALPLPAVANSAGGLFWGILVLAMLVLRAMIFDATKFTWPDAFGVPLAILAGAVALGVSPDDSIADVASRAGWVAFLASAGAVAAFLARRPQGWGTLSLRKGLITAGLCIALIVWNHLYQFPDNQGMALVMDLVGLALFWNMPAFGKTQRKDLPNRSAWAHRVIESVSLAFIIGYTVSPAWFFYGSYDPGLAVVTILPAFITLVAMLWLEDRYVTPKDA